jgi:cytochrome c biogenesis protein CcdA
MLDSVINALQETSARPLGFALAFAIGVLSAAVSACCVLPVMGALAGYSFSHENAGKGAALRRALFFTLGTVVSLMVIGGTAGLAGKAAYAGLGVYWKIFAGVVMILLGLATLGALPFKLPQGRFEGVKNKLGASGAVLSGFLLGGLVAAGSLCCNPGLFAVIGVAMLQRQIVLSALLMGMYAVGFSLPLGAILLGVSLGKVCFLPKGADAVVRRAAGGALLLAGFYFLMTF